MDTARNGKWKILFDHQRDNLMFWLLFFTLIIVAGLSFAAGSKENYTTTQKDIDAPEIVASRALKMTKRSTRMGECNEKKD